MTRVIHSLVLLAIVAAVAIAGCGGGGSDSANASGGVNQEQRSPPSSQEPTSSEPGVLLDVAALPGLGEVVVDSPHKTLYYFDKDKRGSGKTHCYGACARIWRPKLSGVKPGVVSPQLYNWLTGTIARRDGTVQATYNGWPLYTYFPEWSEQTKGVGRRAFGGTWHPLHPDGTRADSAAGGERP